MTVIGVSKTLNVKFKNLSVGGSFQNYLRIFLTEERNMAVFNKKKIDEKQRKLRDNLWPDITDKDLWFRQKSTGFVTIPRTMPLIQSIMDNMSIKKPISSTYLELFCRDFDISLITLSKPREMSFHAGFTGQRGERTWKERLKILHELGFINLKEGPSGPMSYALILNPYLIIKHHYEQGNPGITNDKYNALQARAIEIGAEDLDSTQEDKDTQ